MTHTNRSGIVLKPLMWSMALLLAAFTAGCGGGGGGGGSPAAATVAPGAAGTPGASATDPTVGSATPGDGATNVPTSTQGPGPTFTQTGTLVTASFTRAMNPATITPVGTFTLRETIAGTNVPGTVTMNGSGTMATFTPTAGALLANTQYTATVSTAAMSAAVPGPSVAMASPVAWSFTTSPVPITGQAPVNLGTAGDYVIFADTGISNATTCLGPCITGDMGVGPGVTSTAITGFGLIVDASNTFSTSAQVSGQIYAADYIGPPATTPARVNTASLDMGLAYNDAAGRPAGVGPNLNLGGGTITTQTLAPGVYTWGTAVTVTAGNILTLSGGPNDVWIFQIAGDLTIAATASVILAGGALPKNVFWQVAGAAVTVGAAPAHFEGVVLCGPICAITFGNQATANSRLLSQTSVNLDASAVTQPAP